MGTLRNCIGKAGKLIKPVDADAMLELARQHVADGYKPAEAERHAVATLIEQSKGNLTSVYRQIGIHESGKDVPGLVKAEKPDAGDSIYPVDRIGKAMGVEGWKHEDPVGDKHATNPNALKIGNATYPTMVSPDGKVKIALDTTDIFVRNGSVWVGDSSKSSPSKLTIQAIVVDPMSRGTGLARPAMLALMRAADKAGITLSAEPVHMKQFAQKFTKSLPTKELVKFYKRLGFEQRAPGSDLILEYRPKDADEATQPQSAPPQPPLKRKSRGFSLGNMPDGTPDVLNAIDELGGIKPPPKDRKPGGEYDEYKETFGSSHARLLRNESTGLYPDKLVQHLEDKGYHFESTSDMYSAVGNAIKQRIKMRDSMRQAELLAPKDQPFNLTSEKQKIPAPSAAERAPDVEAQVDFTYAPGEHPFLDSSGRVDMRVLLGMGKAAYYAGATGGGAAYGYSQGKTPEEKIKLALEYGGVGLAGSYLLGDRKIIGGLGRMLMGGVDMPNFRKASAAATDKAFELASARVSGAAKGVNLAAQVLGDKVNDPVFAKKFGAVLVQEMQEAKIGQIQDQIAEAVANNNEKLAQDLGDDLLKVKNVWDMPDNGGIASQADFESALNNPDIQGAIDRHKTLVQAEAEQIHKDLGGKIAAVGPNTGVFINTEAILPDHGTLGGGANRGNLQNVLKRKTAFGKTRTGSADQYQIDYNDQVSRMAAGNAERIAKKRYYDTLVSENLAVRGEPGFRPPDPENYKRERVQELSVTGKLEDYWIKKDLWSEHRQLMNTDSPLDNAAMLELAKRLNLIQLKGVTDPVFHTANILSSIAGSQGGGGVMRDLARQIPGVNVVDALVRVGKRMTDVVKMDPQTRADLAEVAKIGALRDGHPGIVNAFDRAGRLVMNDLFQNLVDRGLAQDTQGNRRDFVNQVGQYNTRLMGKTKALMKEAGVAPFVVAGQNFNQMGVRRVTMSPGVKTTGAAARAQMMATNLAGTAVSLTALPMAINYLVSGKVGGPPGTPVGAIGWKDDKGVLHVVDPLKFTNMRRGMRLTGINAVATGLKDGRDLNHSIGQAKEDILNAAIHPWAGPAVNAGMIMETGKSTSGFQEAEVANPLDRTNSPTAAQLKNNVVAAADSLQPQIAAGVQGARRSAPGGGYGPGPAIASMGKSLAGSVGYTEKRALDPEAGGAETALYKDELAREDRIKYVSDLAGRMPTMTPDQKRAAARELLTRPDAELVAKDLVDELDMNQKGFTTSDKKAKAMGVEDGARARFFADQIEKLSAQDGIGYIAEKEKKGLLTDAVGEQLVAELQSRGWFKSAKKP